MGLILLSTVLIAVVFIVALFWHLARVWAKPTHQEREWLNGKTVLITGASHGVGMHMAEYLIHGGFGLKALVLWDIDQDFDIIDGGCDTGHGSSTTSTMVRRFQCDVADEAMVAKVACQVVEEVGTVDVVINNAGVVTGSSFVESTTEQLRRTIEVNLLGQFWTVKAFLPAMMKRGSGRIVNVGSVAGMIGTAGIVDYCSSKAAVNNFSEGLRAELALTCPGISVSVVCPFLINTAMFSGVSAMRFQECIIPTLEATWVAQKVIDDALLKLRATVVLPEIIGLLGPLSRLAPDRVIDIARHLLRIDHAMDTWSGRGREWPMRRIPSSE